MNTIFSVMFGIPVCQFLSHTNFLVFTYHVSVYLISLAAISSKFLFS